MSSTNKTTSRGGKGVKGDVGNKSHKQDKTDTGKSAGDKQQHTATAEQLHLAKLLDRADNPSVKEKVKQVMDMTRRSEEEVCAALHECDYDPECAVNMLFETNVQGEWETTVKKKKSRQASASKGGETGGADATDEWTEPAPHTNEREKTRNKGGSGGSGPPRMRGRGHNDSRGWRGRERHENERNLEEGGPRRGRSNGPSRGGGRLGRGGSRPGARSYQSRDTRGGSYGRGTVETWDECVANNSAAAAAATDSAENWDNNEFPSPEDWYNEEYTGSLADSKVFTPSGKIEEDASSGGGGGGGIPGPEQQQMVDAGQSAAQQLTQALEMRAQQQQPPPSPVPIVGTLSAAQTQYLNQLTQQNVDSSAMKSQQQQHYGGAGGGGVATQYGGGPASANATVNSYSQQNYATMNSYGNAGDGGQSAQQLPARAKTQRARVPPPSKIPSSAVEMPGDLNSSIGYLDVQFGAMDFMSDPSSFDGVAAPPSDNKYSGTNTSSGMETSSMVDLSSAPNQSQSLDSYGGGGGGGKPGVVTQQSSISAALSSQGQILSNADNIPQSNEHISGNYSSSRGTSGGAVNAPPSSVSSGLELSKQNDSYSSQQSGYNSYPKGNTYQPQSYSYSTGAQVSAASTYTSNQPSSNSYANSNSSSYNTPNATNSSYQNAYSTSSTYQSGTNAFPSITQTGSFPANNQSYTQQNTNQSVYGTNSGLNNSSSNNYSGSGSSGVSSSTAANQYNSYNASSASSTHNHKLNASKGDSTYDNASSATSNSTPSTTNSSAATGVSASPAALGLNSQTTTTNNAATGTKVTTSAAKSSSVVANIPPGVAPMMGTQYIMGQAGVPYFQQPMYSYEDLQVLQQRMPHMTAGYYDMSYQTPTTLPTVRDAALGNVAYSTISDGRFTRGDNASPVPSTLSQQTNTQHQAPPMLNAAGLPPGYTYFYNASVVPGSFQYGAPTAIYPQMPAATNAHGSSNSTQYAKPGGYGSGYGSGYDTLSQTQDYSKGAYVGGSQAQSKASGANAASTGSSGANDLSVIYGKSHAALGKVNSYEKQGFHSGTPPPFTLAGNQNAGLAPSGNYGPQMFIPTMAPHQQHHSTPMMHQPLHQMEVRHQGRRMDSANSSGQRSQTASQAKSGTKQGYPNSYWNQA